MTSTEADLHPGGETALAVAEPPSQSIEGLIALAIQHGAAVEPLERLMAMRQTLKAEAAREAFFEALSAFQSECPVIPKRKTAGAGSYTYRYAPLDVIVHITSPIMRKFGLSYRFDTRFEADPPAQVVVCTVHHRDGHQESSEFRTPVDASARMNDMQKSASAQTYAKRYAFCNAFGILTGDDDDDGASGGSPRVAPGANVVAPRPAQPTSSPRPVGKNLVPLKRVSRAQDSDESLVVAEIPAPPTRLEQLVADAKPDPLAGLRQEMVERTAMLEIAERSKNGLEPLPEGAVMARAASRCNDRLSKLYEKKLETASQSELMALGRTIDHAMRKLEES